MGKNLVVFFFEENSLDQIFLNPIQKVVATKIASRDYYTALIIILAIWWCKYFISVRSTKTRLTYNKNQGLFTKLIHSLGIFNGISLSKLFSSITYLVHIIDSIRFYFFFWRMIMVFYFKFVLLCGHLSKLRTHISCGNGLT